MIEILGLSGRIYLRMELMKSFSESRGITVFFKKATGLRRQKGGDKSFRFHLKQASQRTI
jgi:hypothetical protein